jgi:hypothetical protein
MCRYWSQVHLLLWNTIDSNSFLGALVGAEGAPISAGKNMKIASLPYTDSRQCRRFCDAIITNLALADGAVVQLRGVGCQS